MTPQPSAKIYPCIEEANLFIGEKISHPRNESQMEIESTVCDKKSGNTSMGPPQPKNIEQESH